jgi:hypothetical protein
VAAGNSDSLNAIVDAKIRRLRNRNTLLESDNSKSFYVMAKYVMNRTRLILLSTFCVVFIISWAAVWIYPRFKEIKKTGPSAAPVASLLSGGISANAALIESAFNKWEDFDSPDRPRHYRNNFPDGSRWNRFFLFRRDDSVHPLFPSDGQILLNGNTDAFLRSYAKLPIEQRARDFYLYEPSGDYYWYSEYQYGGRPAKFRCAFLIHLEPYGTSQTKVEILEYQPEIWVGEYFGLSAHSIFPAFLHDIRPVPSTAADRNDVLSVIKAAGENPRE